MSHRTCDTDAMPVDANVRPAARRKARVVIPARSTQCCTRAKESADRPRYCMHIMKCDS